MKTKLANLVRLKKNIEKVEAKTKILLKFLNHASCMCCEGVEFMSCCDVLKSIEKEALETIRELQKIEEK